MKSKLARIRIAEAEPVRALPRVSAPRCRAARSDAARRFAEKDRIVAAKIFLLAPREIDFVRPYSRTPVLGLELGALPTEKSIRCSRRQKGSGAGQARRKQPRGWETLPRLFRVPWPGLERRKPLEKQRSGSHRKRFQPNRDRRP